MQVAPVGADEPDLVEVRALREEREPLPVGRPAREPVLHLRRADQDARRARGEVNQPNVAAVAVVVGPVDVRDHRPVGRGTRVGVLARVPCEDAYEGPLAVGQREMRDLVGADRDDELIAVGHPDGRGGGVERGGQFFGNAAARVHDVDMSLHAEGQPFAVGRPLRGAVPPIRRAGTRERYAAWPSAFRGHDVDVGLFFAVPNERDAAAVGREAALVDAVDRGDERQAPAFGRRQVGAVNRRPAVSFVFFRDGDAHGNASFWHIRKKANVYR
ncbi:MAG: hypothetical protein PGMFKBFP_00354 [Anaerolineales bacterium]|nr:hypothetical protein [Anaerolineales bacterium]